eukprot:15537-Heterococcus_DN1.PRE.1
MGRMNGGPNRAIRQAMKKNIMQRAEKMILTGVYATPAWYEALRYIPPYVRGPKNAKDRKSLVFPTDALVKEYHRRNPNAQREPMSREPNATPPLSFQFACRQLAHIQRGVDRESAYKLAEKEMAVEAEDKLKLNRKMIDSARAVAGTGATPAFLADPAVYKMRSRRKRAQLVIVAIATSCKLIVQQSEVAISISLPACSLCTASSGHLKLFLPSLCHLCLSTTTPTTAVLIHHLPTNNNRCLEADGVEGYDITEAILTLGRDAKSSLAEVAAICATSAISV